MSQPDDWHGKEPTVEISLPNKWPWEVERDRIKARDEMILRGMREGVNDIAEKHARAMCFDHPGMVYPRMNHVVFSEVKACIVTAILEAKGEFWTPLCPQKKTAQSRKL